MKALVFDLCLIKDKKLTLAVVEYNKLFKWGKVKIYLCKEHRNYFTDNRLDKFPEGEEEKEMKFLLKMQGDAENAYNELFENEKQKR